ncbi:hypothetical protein B4U79_09346 [Dinothrombium tinctorium]|uniref:Uncharacterized protein n=1 Tax=Dinothrombium tinctorium TaxID=1965070 RepID=A0A443QF86_9ACAR|nr:hypothetical protein B4U79_09346 [Dinothrombium tinctorium]
MRKDNIPEIEITLKGHRNEVMALDFMPSGEQLVSVSSDGSVIYWNLIEDSRKHTSCYRLLAHKDIVFAVNCAANGSYFLTASRDKSIRLWKVDENEKPSPNSITYKCPATVRAVDSSPDCEYFCSAHDDKTVKLWSSLHTNKYICSLLGHCNWVRCCKYSRSKRCLIASCGDDSSICLFDTREKQRIAKVTASTYAHFLNLDWYPKSDSLLAVSSQDASIRIYDIRMNKLIQYYSAHNQSVNAVSIHPSGGYLLSSSSDETSKIFDLLEGRILFTLRIHKGTVFTCKFSPDGETFATAGSDKVVNIWKSNLLSTSRTEKSNAPFATEYIDFIPKPQSLSEVVFNKRDSGESNYQDVIDLEPSVREQDNQIKTESSLQIIINQLSKLTETVCSLEERITRLEREVAKQN